MSSSSTGGESDEPSAGAPPSPPPGPAAKYRARRAKRSAPYYATIGGVIALVVLAVVVYAATLPPPPTAAVNGPPVPTLIDLGKASVGSVSCGTDPSLPTEKIPWISATGRLTTAELTIEIVELGDGDIVGGPTSPPEVTAFDVCTGSPPTQPYTWYVVLTSPQSQNEAFFSFSQGWQPVEGSPNPAPIQNDSTLTLLVTPSLANLGYGMEFTGVTNGPPVIGEESL